MITLSIDASTYVGTVAVVRDGEVLAEAETAMRGREEERLMPAVAQALATAGVGVSELGRIVCGEGPGSFTSLRIAASIAKGLAFGAGLPLFAVSSLALLVAARRRPPGRYMAAIDALRDEWYVAEFSVATDGRATAESDTRLAGASEVRQLARAVGGVVGVIIFESADGEPPTLRPAESDRPHASGIVRLDALLSGEPVSLSAWEPRYGRLAEAQVKWERAHGRRLDA